VDGPDPVVRATLRSTSPDALARIPLFEGLPRPVISRLLGHLHKRPVPAGTNLLVAEQPGEAVYVILLGSVKAYASRPDGTGGRARSARPR
jgi:CRP-like cAMP-binding protein